MSTQFGMVTGKVTRILLIDPDGAQISLSKVDDWMWKPDVKRVPSVGLDGVRENLDAYNGASGSFTAELKDSGLYDFFQARKNEYQTNGSSRYSTFYGYIDYPTNGGFATQVLQFTAVDLVMESGGEMKNEETVKMKIGWEAQDWIIQ